MQITVVTCEFVGDPIQCWCPAEFTENEVSYTNYVCWVSNTYYIPFSRPIPKNYEIRRTDEITYYQWVPLILLLMAFLFKLPRSLWKALAYTSSGVGLKRLLDNSKITQIDSSEDREKKLKAIAGFIDQWLSNVQHSRAGMCPGLRERLYQKCNIGIGRHYGNYLVFLCVFVKLLFFLNAIGQLYFLNEFLGGDDFYIYGYEVIESILTKNDWSRTRRFPRVTICDFDLRQLQNVQRWSVQCILPINLYNEKFFIFLWFWITIVAILSLFNLMYSILLIMCKQPRKSFAMKYLKVNNIYDTKDKDMFMAKLTNRFISNYLRQDGIFLLKIMSSNTNTVMVSDIVRHLWDIFRKRQFHLESNGSLHTVHRQGEPATDRNSRLRPPSGRIVHLKDDIEDIDEEVVPLRHVPAESYV
ncbi:hypothetical protein FSP39_011829 [Pinctada imbricata]|uniref:Innexin n=1 Tax=Pinctada imbricata TaxID=66713 RepID=A0AA88XDP1_PINIB|nr:hypothetical protein FSP39_011829 [Pinctada imbricata]